MEHLSKIVPRFDARQAATIAERHFALSGTCDPLPSYVDQNFRLTTAAGDQWVIKIAQSEMTRSPLEARIGALRHLQKGAAAHLTPLVRSTVDGDTLIAVEAPDASGRSHLVHMVGYLDGRPLGAGEHAPALLTQVGRLVADIQAGLEGYTHPRLERAHRWDMRRAHELLAETHRIQPLRRRRLAERNLEAFAASVLPNVSALPTPLVHHDLNENNILVCERDGALTVCGLIDFGDIVHSCRVFDLAVCAAYACLGHRRPLEAISAVVAGYHRVRPLSEAELDAVFASACARLAVSVTMSARSRDERPGNTYANVSERPAWEAMERLAGVPAELAREHLARACDPSTGAVTGSGRTADEIMAIRRRHLGPSLSLSYQAPLKIDRGWMQYLFDDTGRPYLDCVNNVCHVGHSHPHVVEAIARQASLLNTNTRYLHHNLAAYAERLTATLPDPLSVCFFVCTGSEANDLALRLARTFTGRQGIVTLDGAYHGHTGRLIEISPYKFDGPGGAGAPDHVRVVPMPEGYRTRPLSEAGTGDGPDHAGTRDAGTRDRTHPRLGERLAAPVGRAMAELADTAYGAAAFIGESLLGCGGQVVPAAGYFQHVFAHTRAAGAVCIIDEVQVGFGRVGSHLWAFETQGVIPDIVTMGKPIGNGHPLAAVVTTPEIAQAFANGMEYFNTFGGNPVSCAAGLAVLDVIEEEGLQAHAHTVGGELLAGLRGLADRHALIGEVRGLGLFIGIELVRDRATLEPADDEATIVIERMKARGILLSTDGPLHNVLKIKPPMPFAAENAEALVTHLDAVLTDIPTPAGA